MLENRQCPATSKKVEGLEGVVTVPGDKSISHRALILGSQAIGTTKVTNLLESEDVINTANSLKSLGVEIDRKENNWVVNGVGIGGLSKPEGILNMGNSGTGVRLMMGLVSSYDFPTTFTGDESLRKRPMGRVITPLEEMGAEIKSSDSGKLPLTICAGEGMHPIEYKLPVPSAQVKSAILLAALNIPGETKIIELEKTRNHTELMMEYLGIDIKVKNEEISVIGQQEFDAKDINVPSDPSSAAFAIVAALIVPGSKVTVKNVCINHSRIGLYNILKKMGANIKLTKKRSEAGEPIADIEASYSKLKGINVPAKIAPSMIDEYPILSIAASVAKGTTVMKGLGELRVKESDRLSAIAEGLEESGVEVETTEDSLTVRGSGKIKGGSTIRTHMDHRIAMSFLILGMISEKPITVDDVSMINTSFPGFVGLMNSLGAKIKVK